jgi:outer membrane protein TolC
LYDETTADYRQTTLTAFQQVEDNLAALRILAQNLQQQDAAVQSAKRYLSQATTRNVAGLDPYLNVLTAQVDLLVYQQTYVGFQTQQMVASVQLIKALGGGWDTSQLPSSKQMTSGVSKARPNGN